MKLYDIHNTIIERRVEAPVAKFEYWPDNPSSNPNKKNKHGNAYGSERNVLILGKYKKAGEEAKIAGLDLNYFVGKAHGDLKTLSRYLPDILYITEDTKDAPSFNNNKFIRIIEKRKISDVEAAKQLLDILHRITTDPKAFRKLSKEERELLGVIKNIEKIHYKMNSKQRPLKSFSKKIPGRFEMGAKKDHPASLKDDGGSVDSYEMIDFHRSFEKSYRTYNIGDMYASEQSMMILDEAPTFMKQLRIWEMGLKEIENLLKTMSEKPTEAPTPEAPTPEAPIHRVPPPEVEPEVEPEIPDLEMPDLEMPEPPPLRVPIQAPAPKAPAPKVPVLKIPKIIAKPEEPKYTKEPEPEPAEAPKAVPPPNEEDEKEAEKTADEEVSGEE